jgi:hypothetical protein
MTARTLIRDALQEIGAIAAGEAITAADASASLTRLNSLIDAAQTERLTIYNLNLVTIPLVADQQVYTIGDSVTADVHYAVRPQSIQQVTLWVPDDTPYERPMRGVTSGEWASISMKGLQDVYPTTWYYNPTFPLGSLAVYPEPSEATCSLLVRIPLPLAGALTLDTALVLAPGYEEYLRYNLAVRLFTVFGRPADPVVMGLAADATARIKHANAKPMVMEIDPMLRGSGGGGWNWMTGGF